MVKKKKLKDEFKEFRKNEKSSYKTFKIPLKSILQNRNLVQPVLNNLVFEMNLHMKHKLMNINIKIVKCDQCIGLSLRFGLWEFLICFWIQEFGNW